MGIEDKEGQRNSWQGSDRRTSRAIIGIMRPAFNGYFEQIRELDLVSQVLLGIDQRRPRAHLIHILKGDITGDQGTADPRYAVLTDCGGMLEDKLPAALPLEISYVEQSDSRNLIRDCKASGIKVRSIFIKNVSHAP